MVIHRWYGTDDPAHHERVADLLRAAAAPAEPGTQPGEDAALAAFRATAQEPGRTPMHSSRSSFKIALAAAATSGVLLTGGAAAAAAGNLPGPAQDAVSGVMAGLGVDVPGADEHAAGHVDPATDESADPDATNEDANESTEPETDAQDEAKPSQKPSPTHGSEVSKLATTTTLTGRDKGAAISRLASGGKSKAGGQGSAAEGSGHKADGQAHQPTTTPAQPSKPSQSQQGQDTAGGHTTQQHGSSAGHRP
jgi:hypothetical protein